MDDFDDEEEEEAVEDVCPPGCDKVIKILLLLLFPFNN